MVAVADVINAPLIIADTEVLDLENGRSLIITSTGRKYVVALPAEVLREWIDRCDGTRSGGQLLEHSPAEFEQVVTVLAAEGCLQTPMGSNDRRWYRAVYPDLAPWRIGSVEVFVLGSDELICQAITSMSVSGFKQIRAISIEELPDHLATQLASRDVIVVAVQDYPAHDWLLRIDQICADAGVRWIPFRCETGKGFLGPAIEPGVWTDFRDVIDRRLTAELDANVATAHRRVKPPPRNPFRPTEFIWMMAVLATRVERWVAGAIDSDTACTELELDPLTMTTTHHVILPMPNRSRSRKLRAGGPDAITDARSGIITKVRLQSPYEGMPSALRVCAVDVADMRRVLEWPNDRQAFGTSWVSDDAAQLCAAGEAVERYCGNWLSNDREVRTGSYDQLCRAGVRAVDPRTFVLYSEQQYHTRGFPFIPLTTDAECTWVEGFSLTKREAIWVPACLVYVMWHERQGSDEPRYCYPILAGIAAGDSLDHATISALEEVVERDITMAWWANAHPLPQLAPTPRIRALLQGADSTFECTIIHLDNEFDIPVIAAAIENLKTGAYSIGFAARPDTESAATKALAEAFMLQMTCRTLDSPTGVQQLHRIGLQNLRNLKPYRADRRYLDDYRQDFHDVLDLMCQQQIFLDPRAREHVAGWTRNLPERDWTTLPHVSGRSLEAYLQRVHAGGYEVIRVDLTTCDASAAGYSVVRVLMPGLVSNFPAAFPMWGLRRIQDEAVRLGWRERAAAEHALNIFPLAHV
jgi:thiazole/oxazole-forming peptide maturase SagD family component